MENNDLLSYINVLRAKLASIDAMIADYISHNIPTCVEQVNTKLKDAIAVRKHIFEKIIEIEGIIDKNKQWKLK